MVMVVSVRTVYVRTNPAKGSAIGPSGLAAANLAALELPAES